MGERIAAENTEQQAGSGGGEEKSPNKLLQFGRNLWSKTGEVADTVLDKSTEVGGDLLTEGRKIGGRVVDELKEVDTEKLVETGKGAAKDGIDIYQGDKSTGNQTVDAIIDFGKGLNPFKGLTDAATDLGEKGLNGEEITRDDLEGAAQGAGRDLIPVPESLRNLEQIKRFGDQTGLSQPVIDAVKKAASQTGDSSEQSAELQSGELPKIDLVDDAKEAGTMLKGFFSNGFGTKEKSE